MKIYVFILVGLTVALLAQGQYDSGISMLGDGGSSNDVDPTGPDEQIEMDQGYLSSSERYGDIGVSGSADVSVNADLNGSLDICIQSCACSCAAQFGMSASGSAEIDGQGVSASGDASLNAYLGSCGSLPDASQPETSLPDESLPDASLPDGSMPDDSLPDASLPDVDKYVYKIGVHRTSLSYYVNDVVYTEIVDENQQPITYYETVDVDNPFMIDGWIWNSTNDVLTIPGNEAINACLQYEEGSWEKLAVDIVLKQLSSTGSCPIYPGTYNIYKDFQVIEISDDMMSCNDYSAILYAVNDKGQPAFQMSYQIRVDEGQCASD